MSATPSSPPGPAVAEVVDDFAEGDAVDVVPCRFYEHIVGAVLDGRDIETSLGELGPP
ncbi:MAG: hypothetical protein M0Z95_22070 [Actinomycetota bacterium]|jgi:hypothetical protein|nr:hypothetical protein [Actinomycetota bacterium]